MPTKEPYINKSYNLSLPSKRHRKGKKLQKIKADELPVPYRTKSNQKTISVINYYWYRVRMKKRSLRLKMSMTREMKAFGNRSINLRAKPEMKLTVCITAPSTTGHGISVWKYILSLFLSYLAGWRIRNFLRLNRIRACHRRIFFNT